MAALDTEEGLYAAAMHYLQRFTASRAHLRKVLERKARRVDGLDTAAFTQSLDRVIERLARARLLDDALYAKLMARSLHRRGMPARAISQRLRLKGVDAELVTEALASLREETQDADFVAACRYARRRRLGPFRSVGRAEQRPRDLASLGRAGFSYDIARRVIDAESPEALESDD